MPPSPPHILVLLEDMYRQQSPSEIRRGIDIVRRDAYRLALPPEASALWTLLYLHALDPKLVLSPNANTNRLSRRLGNAMAAYLHDPRYKDEAFLRAALVRATCLLARRGALDASALRKLPPRSGCQQDAVPRSMDDVRSNTQLNALAANLRHIGMGTPVVLFRKLERLVGSATVTDASKLRGVADAVAVFLRREYLRVYSAFSPTAIRADQIPTEYERLLAGDDRVLDVILQALRAVVCGGGNRDCFDAAAPRMDVAKLLQDNAIRNRRATGARNALGRVLRRHEHHVSALISIASLPPPQLKLMRKAYATVQKYQQLAPNSNFSFSHPHALTISDALAGARAANANRAQSARMMPFMMTRGWDAAASVANARRPKPNAPRGAANAKKA